MIMDCELLCTHMCICHTMAVYMYSLTCTCTWVCIYMYMYMYVSIRYMYVTILRGHACFVRISCIDSPYTCMSRDH